MEAFGGNLTAVDIFQMEIVRCWPFESQLYTWGSEEDPGTCSSASGIAVITAEGHSRSTEKPIPTQSGGGKKEGPWNWWEPAVALELQA